MIYFGLAAIAAVILETPPPSPLFGTQPPWEDVVRVGGAAIARTLIDPDSARIEWPYTLIGGTLTLSGKQAQTGWYTCGFVNAKNRLGGYVGREMFIIMFQNGKPTIIEFGHAGIAEATCGDLASKGWLRPSGLEAIGPTNPNALPPTTQALDNAHQTIADAGAQQSGGMGLALESTPAGAVILAVGNGSPAQKAGLKVGQILETVGSVSLKGMPMTALAAIMKNQPNRVVFNVTGVGPVTVLRNR